MHSLIMPRPTFNLLAPISCPRTCPSSPDHFSRDHQLCPHPSCLEKRFMVFGTEAELRRHFATEHGEDMSRSARSHVPLRSLLTCAIGCLSHMRKIVLPCFPPLSPPPLFILYFLVL